MLSCLMWTDTLRVIPPIQFSENATKTNVKILHETKILTIQSTLIVVMAPFHSAQSS